MNRSLKSVYTTVVVAAAALLATPAARAEAGTFAFSSQGSIADAAHVDWATLARGFQYRHQRHGQSAPRPAEHQPHDQPSKPASTSCASRRARHRQLGRQLRRRRSRPLHRERRPRRLHLQLAHRGIRRPDPVGGVWRVHRAHRSVQCRQRLARRLHAERQFDVATTSTFSRIFLAPAQHGGRHQPRSPARRPARSPMTSASTIPSSPRRRFPSRCRSCCSAQDWPLSFRRKVDQSVVRRARQSSRPGPLYRFVLPLRRLQLALTEASLTSGTLAASSAAALPHRGAQDVVMTNSSLVMGIVRHGCRSAAHRHRGGLRNLGPRGRANPRVPRPSLVGQATDQRRQRSCGKQQWPMPCHCCSSGRVS